MAEKNIASLFYTNKSVLKSWNFIVDFSEMPKITNYVNEYHVVDVTIPSWNFKQNSVKYGSVPKYYTTLDSDALYNFKLTLEDDAQGNITELVYVLQRTIIDEYGVYKSLKSQQLGDCKVRMYDDKGIKGSNILTWTMENCRFLGAEDWTLSSTNTDSFKVNLTFTCDNMSYERYNLPVYMDNVIQTNTDIGLA